MGTSTQLPTLDQTRNTGQLAESVLFRPGVGQGVPFYRGYWCHECGSNFKPAIKAQRVCVCCARTEV